MNSHDVARQTQVEHEMLGHIMEGLRITMSWSLEGPDASRKVSTLRFVSQSFQRHLERLLALEEYDGYMSLALAASPQLGRMTDSLKAEHTQFRIDARKIVQRLERLPATDHATLNETCNQLLALLGRIEEHSRKEIALIQEAFGREGGGEG